MLTLLGQLLIVSSFDSRAIGTMVFPDVHIHVHSDNYLKYTEGDIIRMLEFLVDNVFVVFAGKVFQQIIGIPMGTNCAPLLADIFL